MTNELLKLAPEHERATGNKIFYEKELAKEAEAKADKMLRGDDGSPEPMEDETIEASQRGKRTVYTAKERRNYEMLCRGEIKPHIKITSQLKCRYVTNRSPFLKIAPLKLEEASLDPYIVVYHDVIYDSEIEIIKQMAKPRVSIVTKCSLI